MARVRAIQDPYLRRPATQQVNAAIPQASVAGKLQSTVVNPFRVAPRKIVSASNKSATTNTPVSTTKVVPTGPEVNVRPVTPQIAPKNPMSALSTLADKMKVAREKGDLGTLAELTSKQYLPQLEQVQSSLGNVNTALVSRIAGDPTPIPTDVNAQRAELGTLAQQLQAARESGDMGTAASLAQRYNALVQAMQQQVTGAPVGSAVGDALAKGGEPVSTIPEGGSGEVPPASGDGAGSAVPPKLQADYDRIDAAVSSVDEQMIQLNAQLQRTGPGHARDALNAQLASLRAKKNGLLQERQNAASQYESTGKYEAGIDSLINTPRAGSQYAIKDLPENLKNEAVQEALAAVKAGQDPQAVLDKYLKYFDQNIDFSLKPPGMTETERTVEGATKTAGIEIAGPDTTDLTTDKSRIDAALQRVGISPEGQKALGLQLETIQKRLAEGGGGFSEDELNKMMAPILSQIARDEQQALAAAQYDLAAQGKATGGEYNAQLASIRQEYSDKRKAAATELVRENMAYKQSGTSEAITALGGIAESERAGALSEKELALRGATTQTELTSQEKQAEVEAQYRQKALFQEGQLTQQGQLIQQELDLYGLNLDKYQTDKGFDEAALDRDLKERLADQEGSIAKAELKFKQIKEAMDQAGKEVERDDARDALIAELTTKVAAGDQDAKIRMESLNVEKDLRQQGLDNDWAQFLGRIQYEIMSGREENDHEMKMLLTRIDAEIKEQGGGGLTEFLAEVAGVAVGAVTGGFGTAAGGWAASQLLGGK